MALIELKDISKIYGFGDATTVALEEVNLTIEKGEFVAVMGPSGCGKSTLMNIVSMLDRPTQGSYSFNNRIVSRFSASRRAKIRRDTVGFVYQSFNLLPRLTVLDNVALPLAYKGITQTRRLNRASAILERVGLGDREYFLPKHLSGGQLQRAAIARALVNNPNIIIADEPTGNLDSESSRLVMEILADIHKTGGTIILVTHNPELTRFASRVVFMHDGLIIGDERSRVGEVPASLKRSMYFVRETSEEDDFAGVSALMSALPERSGKKAKTGKRKYSRRKKAGK